MKKFQKMTGSKIRRWAATLVLVVILVGLVFSAASGLIQFPGLQIWGKNPTTGASTADAGMEEDRLKANMALASDLEGAIKVIKEIDGFKRVTYEAVAGNPYGAAVGVYLGEYKKEVTFLKNVIGGVALIPKAVEKLMVENIDAIVIPAHISEIDDITEVKLSLSDTYNATNLSIGRFLIIDCNGKTVSLSNLITDFEVTNQNFFPSKGEMPDFLKVGIGCTKITMRYLLTILGDFDNRHKFQGIALLGQKMVTTDKRIGLTYSGMGGLKPIDGNTYVNKRDVFLKVDTCIVFLKDID